MSLYMHISISNLYLYLFTYIMYACGGVTRD